MGPSGRPRPKETAHQETLYNGIRLPAAWPPRYPAEDFRTPLTPPYLAEIPQVIPIDRGRQLLVDDFLISDSTLKRSYHRASLHPEKPGPEAGDRPGDERGAAAGGLSLQ